MANVNVVRQIYNVLGLAVGPSPATGYMFVSGVAANPYSGANQLQFIPRVQSAAITLGIPSEDVNEFGILNRLDNIIVAPPDVGLTFDYYLLDGYAEYLMGFAASGQQTFVSGLIDGTQQEKNYFLGVAPEGVDLVGATTITSPNNINVVGIGNGVISNYALNLAVGQIPRVSVTVAGSNLQSYVGSTGKQSPAIDPNTALQVVGPRFTLPTMPVYTGVGTPAALRPGDVVLNFPRSGGFGVYTSGVGSIHVQGVSLSVPINIDPVFQLGNPFPIAKPIRFPVNCTLSVDATMADVAENNLSNLFCSYDAIDLQFQCKDPACNRNGPNGVTIWFNQAKLVNQDYNAAIGQNSTVRMTFTNQLQGIGPSYLTQGVVFSGSYNLPNGTVP